MSGNKGRINKASPRGRYNQSHNQPPRGGVSRSINVATTPRREIDHRVIAGPVCIDSRAPLLFECHCSVARLVPEDAAAKEAFRKSNSSL
ncbi:unnamed protein product, partial [Iphiclides podalirius]